MQDASVNFNWFGNPCRCRCGHCLLRSGKQISSVPYEKAQGIVKRFVGWRTAEITRKKLVITFGVGYSMDFPRLEEHIIFCRDNKLPGDGLLVGGLRQRSQEDLRSFLLSLKQAGISKIIVTFHGMNCSHDKFVNRTGDFDFLMEIARAGTDIGLDRIEILYIRRNNMLEFPVLLRQLDHIPGCIERHICLFDFRGRGKDMEAERLTEQEMKRLPAEILKCVNRKNYRTEQAWIKSIMAREIPEKTQRHYLIPVWEENCEQLKTLNPDSILSVLRERHEQFISSIPNIDSLAVQFGDADGKHLYALRDLEWKWQDRHVCSHPEIDKTGLFDDLAECILTK